MLLVTKGDNGHFRTLRAITYKKILNKSNAMLAACLHLLATFGLECRAFACKKNTFCKKVGGGSAAPHFLKWWGKRPPCPSPSAAYARNVPVAINKRIDEISSNKESFEKAAPLYQSAINQSDYNYQLTFEADTNSNVESKAEANNTNRPPKRSRHRKVAWFNWYCNGCTVCG